MHPPTNAEAHPGKLDTKKLSACDDAGSPSLAAPTFNSVIPMAKL